MASPAPSTGPAPTASDDTGAAGARAVDGAGGAPRGLAVSELDDEALLARLREYLESKGGAWAPGWRVERKQRGAGASAGTHDIYYFNAEGRRFRSRQEAAKAMGLEVSVVGKRVLDRRAAADAAAAWASGRNAPGLPLDVGGGVVVTALGAPVARPGWATHTTVYPLGLRAEWADDRAAVGTFVSEVVEAGDGGGDGGGDGPAFRVSLIPSPTAAALTPGGHPGVARPDGPPAALVVAVASDPDAAWAAAGRRQVGALRAALAANRALIATLKEAARSGDGGGGRGSGGAAGEAAPPAGAAPTPDAPPPPPDAPPPDADPADDPVLDRLLVEASPLESVWGLERFGLASAAARRLIEGLPGLADACPAYRFMDERPAGTWADEEARLAAEAGRGRKRARARSRSPAASG